ncbi:MAG: PaREP1 family protein [Sulfolobaceae archaeon]
MQTESFIINLLKEADELLERGDLVQASEKYYKATEEAIKYLSREKNVSSYLEYLKRKRWKAELLFKAAEELDRVFPGILRVWKAAWFLHVYGFHEMSLNKEIVDNESRIIKKKLLEIFRMD